MERLVSVIIPVYNVEPYMERCLRSLMQQTCDGALVECILVDDESTDGSMDVARRLIGQYQGRMVFRTYRNEKNMGMSATRNHGLEHATGRYIFFMDSDDDLTPDCLQTLIAVTEKHPEAEVVLANNWHVKTAKEYINSSEVPQGVLDNYQLLELYYLEVLPVLVWNALILRELVERHQLRFVPGLVSEDILWTAQLYQKVNRFVFIPQTTYIYEDNPHSVVNSGKASGTVFMPHLVVITRELLRTFDDRHTVSNTLYVFTHLLRMHSIVEHDGTLDHSLTGAYRQLRNQLMLRSLRHGRLVLCGFQLLLYPPFSLLLKWGFFRRNYNKIRSGAYRMAKAFDRLHTRGQ